jgi:hypothetical protein
LGIRSRNPLPQSCPCHQNHSFLKTTAFSISLIFPILSLPSCSLRSLTSKPTLVFLPVLQFQLPLHIKAPLEVFSRTANNHISKSAFLKRRLFSRASIKSESPHPHTFARAIEPLSAGGGQESAAGVRTCVCAGVIVPRMLNENPDLGRTILAPGTS